jgi:hypothetical protein
MSVPSIPEKWKELLLSHHPDLPCFRDDVIIIFNQRVCAGCLFGYPTAMLIVFVFQPFYPESIGISLFLAAFSQLRKLIHDNPVFGHYCRFLAGMALGFGTGGFFWAARTGHWLMAGLLVAGAGIYLIIRAYSMRKKLLQYQTMG